jgi:hypothetical protein
MEKSSKIIMVLDGPEKFTDEFGVEQSADWIPVSFPSKFRFIIITNKKSKSMTHFQLRKYPIISIQGLHSFENFKQLCLKEDFDDE